MSLRVQKVLVKYWRVLWGLIFEIEHKTDHHGLLYEVARLFGRRSRKPGPVYWPFKGSARPKEIDCGRKTWCQHFYHTISLDSLLLLLQVFLVASPPLPFALEWRRFMRSRSGCRLVHIACSVCLNSHVGAMQVHKPRTHILLWGCRKHFGLSNSPPPLIYPVGVYYPV